MSLVQKITMTDAKLKFGNLSLNNQYQVHFAGFNTSIVNYLRNNSALDEILDTDFSNLHKNRLYKISDLLLKNQNAIESALYQKEQKLFNFSEVLTHQLNTRHIYCK